MLPSVLKRAFGRQPIQTTTIVTEAYNLAEGQSEASFLAAVGEVDRIAKRHTGVSVVVVDPTAEGLAEPLLARDFPHITALRLAGQTYDGQKNTVCRLVDSEFIVFLDGDCKPLHKDWLERLLSPMSDPAISGVGGLTLYDDFSITGIAMTVLDFGFLFNKAGTALGCYASNNVAFRRQALMRLPIPDVGIMRCHCYYHTRRFQQAGEPLCLEPRAILLHELPDIEKERVRRGYDYVAALWVDPDLPEACWLDEPEQIASRLLQQNIEFALTRLKSAPVGLGVSEHNSADIEREMRRLIAKDVVGIRQAIEHGEKSGLNRQTRAVRASRSGDRTAA